jgi:hypothetical protein
MYHQGHLEITGECSSDSNPQNCHSGLEIIIEICILEKNTYGGTYSQNGEKYTIKNTNYPGSPIM